MTELLAPAGDKECFKAALCAGADAIYVGGKKYGARAYAGNFEQDDLIECLKFAHLYGRKVYLTVNTLMKEYELEELVPFLLPLYIEGLDGVIVQDLGGLAEIREAFPDLELHASTQMTVTGSYGASLLKEWGISRVVPARELSLAEILEIKKQTGLEVETFVHGAMCYGYSGQCLFSSMLGERSGNRGRCAGPCRLPYDVSYSGRVLNKASEKYPLILKDLCTLEILPELINAGIDSFKIEGRMKTPEYVSFVTGMYRKYIDLYKASPKNYHVSKEDMKLLQNHFSRGGVQTGYYFVHNGRQLVTLDKPGYTDSEISCSEREPKRIDLVGHFVARKNEPISFTVAKGNMPEINVCVTGDVACAAQKCAATKEDVCKQLCKTGNTFYSFSDITVLMDEDLFLPNKALNELRRTAISLLEDKMLGPYRRLNKNADLTLPEKNIGKQFEDKKASKQSGRCMRDVQRYLHVEVRTEEQLAEIKESEELAAVYLSSDSITKHADQAKEAAERISMHIRRIRGTGTKIYIKLPPVCRQKAIKILDKYRTLFEELSPDGFCVGNLESLSYIRHNYPGTEIVTDAGMHLFNTKTARFYEKYNIRKHILSFEMHQKEICTLIQSDETKEHSFILPIYGYIPVLESAGCLLKTNGICRSEEGNEKVTLTDRHRKQRIAVTHCDRCENTIYNSVPLSLHKETTKILDMNLSGIMLKFTIEDSVETKKLLDFYSGEYRSEKNNVADCKRNTAVFNVPVHDFTKGHFAKGVE